MNPLSNSLTVLQSLNSQRTTMTTSPTPTPDTSNKHLGIPATTPVASAPVVAPVAPTSPAHNPATLGADADADADPSSKTGVAINVNSDALHRGDPGRTVDAAIVFNLDPALAMAIAPVYADEVAAILAANPELKLMRDPNMENDSISTRTPGDDYETKPYGYKDYNSKTDYGPLLVEPDLVRRIQASRGLSVNERGVYVNKRDDGQVSKTSKVKKADKSSSYSA